MSRRFFISRTCSLLTVSILSVATIVVSNRGQSRGANGTPVFLKLSVTDDYGRFLAGADQSWFKLFEDGREVPISSFTATNEPISVVVAFDLSGSIPTLFKNEAAKAAYKFVETSDAKNEYLILGFNKQIMVRCNWDCDGDGLKKGLADVATYAPAKNTALYDACYVALTRLQSAKHNRKVILLFTDGIDNFSKLTLTTLQRAVKASSVSIYTFAIGNDVADPLTSAAAADLDQLASISGGRSFYPRSEQAMQVTIEQLVIELTNQYTVGFMPASVPDHKWHSVRITAKPPAADKLGNKIPRLHLRYRESYQIG